MEIISGNWERKQPGRFLQTRLHQGDPKEGYKQNSSRSEVSSFFVVVVYLFVRPACCLLLLPVFCEELAFNKHSRRPEPEVRRTPRQTRHTRPSRQGLLLSYTVQSCGPALWNCKMSHKVKWHKIVGGTGRNSRGSDHKTGPKGSTTAKHGHLVLRLCLGHKYYQHLPAQSLVYDFLRILFGC